MDVHTWDAVYVRAPRRDIHPVVADVAAWPAWWPGLSVVARGEELHLALRASRRHRPQRWALAVVKNRRSLGIDLRYRGDIAGEAEFFYLDEPAGTVVHYLVRGTVPDRGWRWMVAAHRAGARAALNSLKDRFEGARLPGEEPAADLLAEQRRAMVEFAEGVAAWERRTATAPGRVG